MSAGADSSDVCVTLAKYIKLISSSQAHHGHLNYTTVCCCYITCLRNVVHFDLFCNTKQFLLPVVLKDTVRKRVDHFPQEFTLEV